MTWHKRLMAFFNIWRVLRPQCISQIKRVARSINTTVHPCDASGATFLLLPKPGCRHPDSASKPDVKLSLHPAPQWCGSYHEDHRTDGSRDCLSALHTYLGTGPGSCHMQVYSPPSLPHHRSHVSLSWTLLQAFASWEILPRPSHAADNLLHSSGEPWRGYTVPGSCVALRVGLHYTPGYLRDAIWITG